MLKIRSEQLDVFEEAQRQGFGQRTIEFICGRYPQACERFGEQALRDMVALALRKTREHGMTAHADILRYINVMYTLGCEFEGDPAYPWAGEIMKQQHLNAASKINLLVARTLKHLRSLEHS